MSEQYSYFTGRLRNFAHAFCGIWTMLQSQHNAWIHACATIAVVIAGLVFGAVLIAAIGAAVIGVLVLGPYVLKSIE